MDRSPLVDLLVNLPPRHRAALEWFAERAGQIVSWPGTLPDGTRLAGRAKGIYKPSWSEYALSARQSLAGPYPDRPVQPNPDGTWTYLYYQEGLLVEERDSSFGNRALLNCWRDVVPIGVFLQVSPKPDPRYRVLGLALVAGYEEGYFCFEGIGSPIARQPERYTRVDWTAFTPQFRADSLASSFDPRRIEDERRKTLAVIAQRQGQTGFRRSLLHAYKGRCAVTGYDAIEALEAAHIIQYRGPVTNHPTNGLLLRADLHTLFDCGLVSVSAEDSERIRLLISPEIRETAYRELQDHELKLPENPKLRPSIEALRQHRDTAGF